MFGRFRKSQTSNYEGRKFNEFLLRIPEDWPCELDGGKLRASKNDEVRLTVSELNVSAERSFAIDDLLETLKTGYYKTDIYWGAYSEIKRGSDSIRQTLEYDDDPRLIIGVVEKNVQSGKRALIFTFAGNSGDLIEKYADEFDTIFDNVEVLE